MPDRSLRLLTLPPQSVQGRERLGVLLRERPASPPDAPSGGDNGDERGDASKPADDNPFAPPAEGTPDRPWQPRRPTSGDDGRNSSWGGRWSDRQPGRSSGNFGDRPGTGPDGPNNSGNGNGGPGTGMRWDPTDPAQRRGRYALLCGMWAFFFALFSWPSVALMLGALAMYWGISSLRAKPRGADPDNPAPAQTGRPQTTAAISGLVTASLALALVAAGFTAKLVYSDYYTCTADALTNEAKQSCEDHLPKELRGILSTDS
ncbi:hypothetical protein [Streptomyces sp. NPDC003832]